MIVIEEADHVQPAMEETSAEDNDSVDSDETPVVAVEEQMKILGEVVGCNGLTRDDGHEDLSDDDISPYCIIKFGNTVIHKTRKAAVNGTNPIWTISAGSLFLLAATPRQLAQNDLQIAVWFRKKDALQLTTLDHCFLGHVDLNADAILAHCDEERWELDLVDKGVHLGLGKRGTITLRFRLATESDQVLLQNFEKKPENLSHVSARDLYSVFSQETTDAISFRFDTQNRPIAPIVTEADETQVASSTFVNALSSAFKSKSYVDRKTKDRKFLIKPFPDPARLEQTMYMTKQQILAESLRPSNQWVEAGSGTLGKLYLEILACHNLPNVDVGEAVGNVTDAFVCAVFEDSMVQTPVIDDELSPRFMPWTQRAFVFGIMHPASMLYIGAFDYDLGLTPHDPLGRVAVNISNLQRDTEYTLNYNLYPSSNVTDRTSAGSITIRLRVEYANEREALMVALKPRPKFHVNVRKEKSFAVVRYTCFGEHGDEGERAFDYTVVRSYINEIFEYKSILSYCFHDSLQSLVFWRGQVRFFNVLLPVHSFLFFCCGATLVERPYLFPSFSLLSVAWIMMAALTQRRQHPSPWHGCPSFWHYLEILRTGKSSLAVRKISPREGAAKAEAYERAWKERIEKDQKVAATRAAFRQEINTIGDDKIQTKMAHGIPLDLLERLGRYQGYVADYLQYIRCVKIIVSWEEGIVSFWITAVFLVAGFLSLLLPWSFILLWSGRLIVWGLFGPHMKIVDMILRSYAQDDKTLVKKVVENFKNESRVARARRQDAVKLKDVKCLAFGDYITLVPSFNLTRHYDHPVASSFARLHHPGDSTIQLAPRYVPPQQFFGVMVPRTQADALRFEADLPRLERLRAALEATVKAIQESENCSLLKTLKRQTEVDNDMPPAIGYEIISMESESGDECENNDEHDDDDEYVYEGLTGSSSLSGPSDCGSRVFVFRKGSGSVLRLTMEDETFEIYSEGKLEISHSISFHTAADEDGEERTGVVSLASVRKNLPTLEESPSFVLPGPLGFVACFYPWIHKKRPSEGEEGVEVLISMVPTHLTDEESSDSEGRYDDQDVLRQAMPGIYVSRIRRSPSCS